MADADDWSSDATEAFNIRQVQAENGTHRALNNFNPAFTYPIFGDEEKIFGYKGLKINLLFNASDMRPAITIKYDRKFKAVGDTEPLDIEETLAEFLPKNAFDKIKNFDAAINDPITKAFKPSGSLHKTETTPNGTYEFYKANSSEPAVKQLLTRLQILNVLFIEGGTALDPSEFDSGRWTVYTVYKKSTIAESVEQNPYTFVGYATVYTYHPIMPSIIPPITKTHAVTFPYPEDTKASLPVRARISQFVILPPYQHQSLGGKLYNVVFESLQKDPSVFEITVEDPNEAFDDLRDMCDLTYLRACPDGFSSLAINTSAAVRRKGKIPYGEILPTATLDVIRSQSKIAPRQFLRLVEMHLLSTIPTSVRAKLHPDVSSYTQKQKSEEEKAAEKKAKHLYRLWTLVVKQRLYKHNRDSLVQLDRSERIEKLEDAVRSVELDYVRLFNKWDEVNNEGESEADKAIEKGDAVKLADVDLTEEARKGVSDMQVPLQEGSSAPAKRAADGQPDDAAQAKKARKEE